MPKNFSAAELQRHLSRRDRHGIGTRKKTDLALLEIQPRLLIHLQVSCSGAVTIVDLLSLDKRLQDLELGDC